CSKTTKATTVNITCKSGASLTTETISVYPNPSSGIFNLQFQSENETASSATVEIRNELGQMVFQKNYLLTNGTLLQQMQLDGLRTGMYSVVVRAGAQVVTQKILIQ